MGDAGTQTAGEGILGDQRSEMESKISRTDIPTPLYCIGGM